MYYLRYSAILNYTLSLMVVMEIVSGLSVHKESVATRRRKRSIVFPVGSSYMQMVVGVGLPFEVGKQSITTGPFVKSYYLFPTNSSHWTSPSIDIEQEPTVQDDPVEDDESEERKKREALKTRWSLYSTLSAAAQFLGYGDKACVLRAICETAEVPFAEKGGIIAEMLHVIFTPSSSAESTDGLSGQEYLAAERLGRTVQNCKALFPECKVNLMEEFTNIASHL